MAVPGCRVVRPGLGRPLAELGASGLRVRLRSYGGWNDGDRAFAEAVWCIVAHLRPSTVVETGVAPRVTRVILEGLERNGNGHLWSIDLPAVDSALHPEIGIAVPQRRRLRWSYLSGTSRERLPRLLTGLQALDLFVHDSLHTGRNLRFELESAWAALRPGSVVVADDIDHSLGFRSFVETARPSAWLAARHVTGAGLWGVAINASKLPEPAPFRLRERASSERIQSLRARRQERLEQAVVREIARGIKTLARDQRHLLQIDAREACRHCSSTTSSIGPSVRSSTIGRTCEVQESDRRPTSHGWTSRRRNFPRPTSNSTSSCGIVTSSP